MLFCVPNSANKPSSSTAK